MIKYKEIELEETFNCIDFYEKISLLDKENLGITNEDDLKISHKTWGNLFKIFYSPEGQHPLPVSVGYIRTYNDLNNQVGSINGIFIDLELRDEISVTNIFLMILKYMFEHLNLRKISFSVYGFNEKVVKIFENEVFNKVVIKEGHFKDDIIYRGKLYDRYSFSIFRDVYIDLALEQYKIIIDEIKII